MSLADVSAAGEPSPATVVAPRFYFVRHGETDWNRAGRLQGRRDIPLNGRGRDQAAASGHCLKRLFSGRGVAGIDFVASPLGRARATMGLLRVAMGLLPNDFRVEERLTEIGFGRWEGMTWAEIERMDPEAYRARKRDKWGWAPSEGESYAAVTERVRPWLETVGHDSVIVAHGGVARSLLVLATGLDPRRAPAVEIPQGRVLAFADGRAEWI